MKKYKLINHKETLVNVICDICQKSCKTGASDDKFFDFDYLEINGSFGYWSNHDCETWNADICEKCSVNYLDKLICFKKTDYMFGENEQIEKELNKKSDRIRKIRKLTGVVEVIISSKQI